MRKTVGAIAVAATVAGIGGAAIAAATETGFHATSGGFPGGPGGPPPAGAHRFSAEPDSLHGESVVSNGHGGFSTLLTQTGRVTAISPTSVTVRSDDGFVQTYAVHQAKGTGPASFAVNDEITIDGTREGETNTVTTMRSPLSPGH
jgi:hypothetical protein